MTSRATCATGRRPQASSNVLGAVTVLGKRVTLSATGPTDVKVPGVGEARLDFARAVTASGRAAASALELTVSVNPLKLNVADVKGTLTLAKVTCETPQSPADPADPADPPSPVTDIRPQSAPAPRTRLAETGGSSVTPYVAGGALALLVAGGGAVALHLRRR